jgi:hypothetical protein
VADGIVSKLLAASNKEARIVFMEMVRMWFLVFISHNIPQINNLGGNLPVAISAVVGTRHLESICQILFPPAHQDAAKLHNGNYLPWTSP